MSVGALYNDNKIVIAVAYRSANVTAVWICLPGTRMCYVLLLEEAVQVTGAIADVR